MRTTLVYGAALAGFVTLVSAQLAAASYPPQNIRSNDPAAKVPEKPKKIVAERSSIKGTPPGWSQGEKTGWSSGKRPPGQRNK